MHSKSVSLTLALSVLTFNILACSNRSKEWTDTDPLPTGRAGDVVRVSRETKIPEKVLMTVAHTQSRFGTHAELTQASLAGMRRDAILTLAENSVPAAKKSSLYDSLTFLTSSMKKMSASSPPKDNFDWLVLAARGLVGEIETDPNIKSAAVRTALIELIQNYNSGFTDVLSETEVLNVPAATEKDILDVTKLNIDAKRFVRDFKLSTELAGAATVEGNKAAGVGERSSNDVPRILLRWCPGSALACFLYLKNSATSASHFLSFRGSNGARELVQFHSLTQDLNWYGTPVDNTIIVTISGLAGASADNYSPTWLDWEDYVGLKNNIKEIAIRTAAVDAVFDPKTLREIVMEQLPEEIVTPEGKPTLGLPHFWDKDLFDQLLRNSALSLDLSPVKVAAPLQGQIIEGLSVGFQIYAGPDAVSIELYEDSSKPDKPWDLFLKTELETGKAKFDFTRTFRTRGPLSGKARAVKIVTRDASGVMNGSRISTFVVSGLDK